MQYPADASLYVVTDDRLSQGRSHEEVARQALSGGAKVIQFRDKVREGKELHEIASAIQKHCTAHNAVFIVNDRVDVAILAGADGVHVGQRDLPAARVRNLVGDSLVLGVSAATMEEALRAEQDGADYIGFGPVFEARPTKPDTVSPLGLAVLKQACAACSIPVIAIGGITLENAVHVMDAGAHGVAIISAIVSADDIAQTTRRFRTLLDNR